MILNQSDLKVIKEALENYYFTFDGEPRIQQDIGETEIKIATMIAESEKK